METKKYYYYYYYFTKLPLIRPIIVWQPRCQRSFIWNFLSVKPLQKFPCPIKTVFLFAFELQPDWRVLIRMFHIWWWKDNLIFSPTLAVTQEDTLKCYGCGILWYVCVCVCTSLKDVFCREGLGAEPSCLGLWFMIFSPPLQDLAHLAFRSLSRTDNNIVRKKIYILQNFNHRSNWKRLKKENKQKTDRPGSPPRTVCARFIQPINWLFIFSWSTPDFYFYFPAGASDLKTAAAS